MAPAHLGGNGSPLVLLHGLYMTWQAWASVIPMLEGHHTVLAVTLAGHRGGPSLPPDGAGIGPFADAVEKQLDDLGWERAHLVGNSLGGWLAVELARRGRAESVVAFSPAGAFTSKMAFRRVVFLMKVGRVFSRIPGVDSLLRIALIRGALARTMANRPGAVSRAQMIELLRDTRASTALDHLLAGMNSKGSADLSAVDVPMRIVWAKRDRTIPWRSYGVPFAVSLPHAERIILDGVGHVPMYDDPQLVADTILDATLT